MSKFQSNRGRTFGDLRLGIDGHVDFYSYKQENKQEDPLRS